MSRVVNKISNEKEFRIALSKLDARWKSASKIKDPKKRGKEVLRLKKEVAFMMQEFDKMRTKENRSLFGRFLKITKSWLKKSESKYKDA